MEAPDASGILDDGVFAGAVIAYEWAYAGRGFMTELRRRAACVGGYCIDGLVVI